MKGIVMAVAVLVLAGCASVVPSPSPLQTSDMLTSEISFASSGGGALQQVATRFGLKTVW